MAGVDMGGALHLPDLTISGFRGIDRLSVERLGRVTLLAGLNGVGKTTVLEAVRLYAGRASAAVCESILDARSDMEPVRGEGDGLRRREFPDYARLFGWSPELSASSVVVGPTGSAPLLTMEMRTFHDLPEIPWLQLPRQIRESGGQALHVTVGAEHMVFAVPSASGPSPDLLRRLERRFEPRRAFTTEGFPDAISSVSIGPADADDQLMRDHWENIALSAEEERAVEALRIVHGPGVERVVFIRRGGRMTSGARPIVKLKGNERPVPLRSLGSGAVRMFAAALALANCRDGLLLIDEAENGLHHLLHEDYWRLILRTAADNNVQVLATTHSWDSITGFARACAKSGDVEGRAVRIDRCGGSLRAVEYDAEMLAVAADQQIELR